MSEFIGKFLCMISAIMIICFEFITEKLTISRYMERYRKGIINNIIIYIFMMIFAIPVLIFIPTTTGFTVTITANVSGVSENAMNFTGKINSTVYPTGTKNGTYRWGYIYNTGSTSLSFQMASTTPANIVLKVDAKSYLR